MIILLIGIAIFFALAAYFYVCNLKASVFSRIGFVNDEIPLRKVKLEKYYSFNYFGGQRNEKE